MPRKRIKKLTGISRVIAMIAENFVVIVGNKNPPTRGGAAIAFGKNYVICFLDWFKVVEFDI